MTSFLFSSAINNSLLLNAPEDSGSGNKTKRLQSFDEESERNQLKKRRKQSKPIRITLLDSNETTKEEENAIDDQNDDLSEDGGDFGEENLTSNASDCSEIRPQSSCVDSDVNADDEPELQEQLELRNQPEQPERTERTDSLGAGALSTRTAPLDLSKLSSGESDVSVDVLSFLEKTDAPDLGAKHEPVYHPYPGPYSKQNTTSESPFSPLTPPAVTSSFKQFRGPTLKSPIGLAPLRIFNPEAFCNLCNKEFCNKYFLKTHKANKHGIYSENIGASPLDSSFSADYSQNPMDMANTNPAVKFWFSNKPFYMNSTAGSFPKFGSSVSNSTGSGTKAYCNICQRQFCNKYFVRRHKAKIHGITDETTENNAFAQGDYNFLDLKLHFDESQNQPVDNTNHELESREFTTHSSDMNPYNSSETIGSPPSSSTPPDISEKIGTDSLAISASRTKIQLASNVIDCNANSNTSSNGNSCSESKYSCKVCEKEFCSRHSLRRHKAKAHGIVSPVIGTSLGQDVILPRLSNDDSSRCSLSENESPYIKCESQDDLQQDYDKEFISQNSNECKVRRDGSSPLRNEDSDCFSLDKEVKKESFNETQTTVPETNPNSLPPTGPLDLALSFDENKTPQPTETVEEANDRNDNYSCEQCGKHFQSQFLLNMHRTYFHNFSESNNFSRKDVPKSPNSSQEPSSKNEKLLDRVKREHNEEDIQKLHSLIMKLNNLNVEDVTVCEVCNEDLGHISSLENHIIREHGELLDEVSRMIDEEGQPSPSFPSSSDAKSICRVCQNSFLSAASMEQHVCVPSQVPNLKTPEAMTASVTTSSKSETVISESMVQEKAIPGGETQNQTMSSSFCDICKKELCNKYFMKTHMQRMHNISIETGTNVGGVVCDICNKTLCSKYFLRVHKQNSHGIVDDVLLPPRLWMSDSGARSQQSPNSASGDSSLKPSEKTDFSYKYFSHFTEVCPLCCRRFRSTKWLRAHLLNDHGEEGKLKWFHFQNQLQVHPKATESQEFSPSTASKRSLYADEENLTYDHSSFNLAAALNSNENILADILNGKNTNVKQCNYCPFSTKILALLFMHERTHLTMGSSSDSETGFQCPLCRDKFLTSTDLEKHVAIHYNISSIVNSDQEYMHRKLSEDSPSKKKKENGDSSQIDFDSKSVLEHLRKNPALDLNIVRRGHTERGKTFQRASNPKIGISEKTDLAECPASTELILGSSSHSHRDKTKKLTADVTDAVQRMKEALNAAATMTNLPTTYAIPQNQDSYIMQPFFLEHFIADQLVECSTNSAFLSSLVYLPVKQKLSKSVTVSFRLTPT